MGKKIALLFVCLALFPLSGQAADPAKQAEGPQQAESVPEEGAVRAVSKRSSSGLPIPRFVSLSSEKVFVRTGPALRYPIRWVYQRQHMPVEIIQEFDTWRKIRDIDGDDGWVHQSLLSGERTGIAKGEANMALYKEAKPESRIVAYLEPGVVAEIDECRGAWCKVTADGYSGWTERKFLWGIYDSEDFD